MHITFAKTQNSSKNSYSLSPPRRVIDKNKSHLISKYGNENIQKLQNYLEGMIQQNYEKSDFAQVYRFKEKLQILQQEKEKHYHYRKQNLIQYLVGLMEAESVSILEEFQQNYKQQMKQLIEQLQSIEQNVFQIQKQEYEQLESAIDRATDNFREGRAQESLYLPESRSLNARNVSTQILQLKKQIKNCLKLQDYLGANYFQKKLSKQMMKNNVKKQKEWENFKTKSLKNLTMKQQKQLKAMRMRFQNIVQEKIIEKNQQLNVFLKRIKIVIGKIQKNLQYSDSYKELLDKALFSLNHTVRFEDIAKYSESFNDYVYLRELETEKEKTSKSTQVASKNATSRYENQSPPRTNKYRK